MIEDLYDSGTTLRPPQAVGRRRLRATFNGTDVSAPSRSGLP
jgi:hypothetical protein